MSDLQILKRVTVETPYGAVHTVAFTKPEGGKSEHSQKLHRGAILQILSEVAGRTLTPADIVESGEHPRPELPALGFDVNWTHSGNVCVLAYGERSSIRVGVDFEIHKPNRLHIADHFYSGEEAAYLRTLEPAAAVREFFRLWCRKEALYKCVGGAFFEGSIRRNLMGQELRLESGEDVRFYDLENLVEGVDAACCIAVSAR